jgi:hypothetical protein
MPATNVRADWVGGNLLNYPTAAGGYVGRAVSDKTAAGPFGAMIYESVAASAAVTATSTETTFDKSVTIPANDLVAGSVVRVRAQVIATATNSTDTLTLKVKIGGVTLVTTGAVDVANNDIGFIDATATVRTAGASGTMVATGLQGLGVPGTVTAKPFLMGSTALDTTVAVPVIVTAQWSSTNAGNSCRLDVLTVELF